MGYYTRIETEELKVKEEYIEQVKKDIMVCKENSPAYLSSYSNGVTTQPEQFNILRKHFGWDESKDYVFWHIEEMVLNDGFISFEEEITFYGEAEFITYIKDKVTGGKLLCYGEDGETWGYEFDGKGNFKKLKTVWVEE